MNKAKPGEWYFGAVCEECYQPILIWHDKSDGKKPIDFAGPGKLKIKCKNPECNHEGLYGASDIQRFITELIH